MVETVHPKYVVYPAGDRGGRLHREQPLEEGTFFVIRDSDQFSPAALYAYAAVLQTLLEAARQRDFLSDEEYRRLESLESYVTGLAIEWQRAGKGRLPT